MVAMRKILSLILIPLLLSAACAAPRPAATASADARSAATEERYRPGELREYEGTRLDPAVGPADNSIKGIQQVDAKDYRLTVDGLVDSPAQYTYDEVRGLPSVQRLITIHCVEGWDATILWKGVAMKTLLDAAAAKPEAVTVIFHAVDGYTTSLPLAEILQKDLMLAYDGNGIALPPEMGYPFIFVAEDKWGYKWARWVNRIELSDNKDYKGYWESAGYSNEGDLAEGE